MTTDESLGADQLDDLDEWDQPAAAAPQPRFDSVEHWVQDWLRPIVRRTVNERRPGTRIVWCAQWWQHAEAIDRLEACWRAWEVARLDGGRGIADWWLTVMDPMWAQLTSPDGPFSECQRAHSLPPQLPIDPAPTGWWGSPE